MGAIVTRAVTVGLIIVWAGVGVASQVEGPASALEDLPIREVAVFKDGHAFVTHVGRVRVADGQACIKHVPSPVLGTFWASSAAEGLQITDVSAGYMKKEVHRPALSLRDLLKANVGATVTISEYRPGDKEVRTYPAAVLSVPEHETSEHTRVPQSWQYDPVLGTNVLIPERTITTPKTVAGDIVLLKTDAGVRVVPVGHISDITFADQPTTRVGSQEKQRVLKLRVEGADGGSAEVAMAYLQKGLRWIPQYALELGEGGSLRLRLQATLVNELADLQEATVHLVVGVPSFVMADQLSPIALRETALELGQYFERRGRPASDLSNVLMSQSAAIGGRYGAYRGAMAAEPVAGQPYPAGPVEDLFVYRFQNVSLKRGERMVLPVVEVLTQYEDVYLWEIPFAPPGEVLSGLSREQRALLARSSEQAHLQHALRISNDSPVPWTTGPALVLRDGRLLGQGLMTYTSVGNSNDLTITAATDIHTRRSEEQTGFTADAIKMRHTAYSRIDLAGKLTLTNFKDQPVHVEVRRAVLGQVDKAGQDGELVQLNWMEAWEDWPSRAGDHRSGWPLWVWRYDWPQWWGHLNGVGQVSWEFDLPAGESQVLTYEWHYFWH